MIIGSWDIERADGTEKWTDNDTDYIVIRLDFNAKEMRQLERFVGIKKADCTSWVTCIIQANEDYTDCELIHFSHFTDKEIHNGKRGYEYYVPSEFFSDDAISFLLDFAFEKLNCKPSFEVLHDDYTHKEWPTEYQFSKEEIDSEPIVVE